MSTHVLRRGLNSYDVLERMLNRTSLSTKRIGHEHILDRGADVLTRMCEDADAARSAAVVAALEAAEKRHVAALRAALCAAQNEAADEKARDMDKQKQFYEDLAERVNKQRDCAEEEHIRVLTRQHDKDREEALCLQWEEAERRKERAILDAERQMAQRLRTDFEQEKKAAIRQALREAAEQYTIREEETIKETQGQCAQEAADEASRVAQLHTEEVSRITHRYDVLNQRYHKELDQRHCVEHDFRDLQTDYARFMDTCTDGRYNSSFMMKTRHHGNQPSLTQHNVVQYEQIQTL